MSCSKGLFQTCFSLTTTVTASHTLGQAVSCDDDSLDETCTSAYYKSGFVFNCLWNSHGLLSSSGSAFLSQTYFLTRSTKDCKEQDGERQADNMTWLEECSMCYRLLLALVFRSYQFDGTWCTCRRHLCRPTDRFDLRGLTSHFLTITRRS